MSQRMFAVFVAPDGVPALLANVEGDHNDQNLSDAFIEMYRDSLARAQVSEVALAGAPGDIHEVDDNVFFQQLPTSMGRRVGKMVAGFIGFERDYVREDSDHFVVYVDLDV